jgi:hypothetical protein
MMGNELRAACENWEKLLPSVPRAHFRPLVRSQIYDLEDIQKFYREDLLDIPQLGKKGLRIIEKALLSRDVVLKSRKILRERPSFSSRRALYISAISVAIYKGIHSEKELVELKKELERLSSKKF